MQAEIKNKNIFKKIYKKKQKLDTDFFHLNYLEKFIIKIKKIFFLFYYKNIQINYLPKNYVIFYLSYQPEASTCIWFQLEPTNYKLIVTIRSLNFASKYALNHKGTP